MFQCMYINPICLVTLSCYEFDPGASLLRLSAIRPVLYPMLVSFGYSVFRVGSCVHLCSKS